MEEESLEALQQKNYSTALKKLNQLLRYDVTSHEIIFSKLICLIELGYFDEAQSLCEEQLKNKCQDYYDYVHLYLTILFQTGQYQKLMEQVDFELNNKMLPSTLKGQFHQLYELSKKMNNDVIVRESTEHVRNLKRAIEEDNNLEQWRLIRHLHKLNSEPTDEIIHLLEKETVHPVTKTAIFMWLQDKKVNKQVFVTKFNLKLTTNPVKISSLLEHDTYKLGMSLIYKDEQKNPTLTKLLEQLLYRYIFVRFPIMPSEDEIYNIVEAIKKIGKQNLHSEEDENVSPEIMDYIAEINLCETLYLSIIEE